MTIATISPVLPFFFLPLERFAAFLALCEPLLGAALEADLEADLVLIELFLPELFGALLCSGTLAASTLMGAGVLDSLLLTGTSAVFLTSADLDGA